MLCILPNVDASDLTINIQHKLIEAYCWENTVNLVKVGIIVVKKNSVDMANTIFNAITNLWMALKGRCTLTWSY